MIKIIYTKPEILETAEEISIHNIKTTDKFKKIDYLEISCISWLKLDSKRNYQDLEKLLRDLNLNTYIIAQPIDKIPNGLELGLPNLEQTNNKFEYVAKILCGSKEDMINEILRFHSSYEDNYECLNKTGCLKTIKKQTDKEEEEKISNKNGVVEIKNVLESKLKLEFRYLKPIESINFVIADLTNKYGKKPEEIACGEINGNKVYGLVLNGNIVSPIGWIKKNINKKIDIIDDDNNEIVDNNDDIEYELVDFRNIKIEKS